MSLFLRLTRYHWGQNCQKNIGDGHQERGVYGRKGVWWGGVGQTFCILWITEWRRYQSQKIDEKTKKLSNANFCLEQLQCRSSILEKEERRERSGQQ